MPELKEHLICRDCGKEKPVLDFYASKFSKSGYFPRCKLCQNTRTKVWREANLEHHKELIRARKWELKLEAIAHYGGKCTCCGETEPKFLEIDHKYNNGAEHRREIGGLAGSDFIRWLKKNNWPEYIQLLCSNCNMAKYRYGVCPHAERLDG